MSDSASDPKAGRSYRKSEFIGFLVGMVIALLLLTCIAVLASLY
jgi:tetrahydromethanopterin S-methyltransferase subunit F